MPSSTSGFRPLGIFISLPWGNYVTRPGTPRGWCSVAAFAQSLSGTFHGRPCRDMTNRMGHTIHRLTAVTAPHLQGLAELLIDCVEGGASVSLMLPLPTAKALDFWRGIADGVTRGERALLVAEDPGGIMGTVQLILDQPENQPHRADLSKMLVHRRARRRGVGAALLR